MSRLQRLFAGVVVFGMVTVAVPFGPSSEPVHAQTSTASFAEQMMQSAAKGAASASVNQVFGWVLGSAGSANGDVVVLNEILDELNTIENTLQGIENEIAELIDSIDQLDCDTWVQTAEPMVNAISNLWDPNSASAGPGAPPPPQQSYVGIVAETKNNTVTLADMEAWADQVLNNNGMGIDGKSIQDLSQVLIPPAGGSGIIKGCLTVPANGPSNFDNQTDDVYYNAVVAPLIDYYYAIQTQGMTMAVDALNFEAWQTAGSPISDSDDIEELPMTVCNGATGDVAQFCENADWVVLGTDGLEEVAADGSLLDVVSGDEIDVSSRLRRNGSWFQGQLRVLTGDGWTSTPLKFHEDSITAHEPDAYVRIEFGGEIGNRGPRISGVITVEDFN